MHQVMSRPGAAADQEFAADQPSLEQRLQRRELLLHRLALARTTRRKRRAIKRAA
jgi:hypothetical protein